MMDMIVRGIRIEAEDIRSFELAPVAGALPAWQAGAHVLVEAAAGVQRAYSLCNHAGETGCYRIAVKREPASRGGSSAMHALRVGDRLRVGAPANLFEIDASATRHVLLAGGIGITPLYAMRNALLAAGAAVQLHSFARSASHEAFGAHLSDETRSHYGLDATASAARLAEIAAAHAADDGTRFYLCGPAAFMDAASSALDDAGISAARIRSERFGAATSATPQAATTAAGGFRVRFERSGIEAEVPAGVPIIAVARELGVDIPTSCEMGVCGACHTKVLAGDPEHLDQYLSADEQAAGDCILPCVSRGRCGVLVIDR